MKLLVAAVLSAITGTAFAQPVPVPPTPPVPPSPQVSGMQMISKTVMRTCTVDDKGRRECSEQISDATPQGGAVGVLDDFGKFLKEGNTNAAAALLADDVKITEGGKSETKKQYLASHIAADAKFLAGVQTLNRNRQARVVNGVATIETVDTIRHGKDTMEMSETATLREINGKWLITGLDWKSKKVAKNGGVTANP